MPAGSKSRVLETEYTRADKEAARKKSMTPKQLREENEKLKRENAELEKWMEHGTRCCICGRMKLMTETTRNYYRNSDPISRNPVSNICRDCANMIALRAVSDGVEKEPTKDSIRQALFYLNRPFLEKVWDNASKEFNNQELIHKPQNMWKAYVRHITNGNYDNLTFMDSDGLTSFKMAQERNRLLAEEEALTKKEKKVLDKMTDDVRETYLANKRTTIRFLGYDPFVDDPIEEQPILYAKLVNYFDDSVRDDGFKLDAIIEIVQNSKYIKSINDAMTAAQRDFGSDPSNVVNISRMAEVKKKLTDTNLALAKDNGISVNHNKQSRKGAGTLSGIIKEMNEMNLDDIEINTFDYETSAAMAQVEANSIKNILTQLNPDENDWQKEITRQAELLFKLQDERDKAVEYCRLLRKENKDLKDFMQEHNWIDANLNVIEDDVVSEQGGDNNG